MNFNEVLDFWFDENNQKKWFEKSKSFDNEIRERFYEHYQSIVDGRIKDNEQSLRDILAIVIILDQFPRNMFRNQGQAFMSDVLALQYARKGIELFNMQELTIDEQVFLCMPFMHSESLEVQEESLALYRRIGREKNIHYALEHYKIIEKFGRFPFRNQALNRASSQEELDYMANNSNF